MSNRFFSVQTIAAAAWLCAQAFPLAAQSGMGSANNRLIRFSVSGGATLPSGELKKLHDIGFHADGALILNIPGFPVRIRPELSFTKLKFKDGIIPPVATTDPTTQLLSGIGNIEIPLVMGLYALAGVGALNVKNSIGATSDSSQTNVVINAGAGLRARIKRVDIFVEAKVGSASYDKGTFGYSKAQYIPITFGLLF
ncbi:MAG: hypothetical protein ABJC26_18210 [Gemmatimonadaceae bacterium]